MLLTGHVRPSIVVRFCMLGLVPCLATFALNPFLAVYLTRILGYPVVTASFMLGAAATLSAGLTIVAGRLVDRTDRTLSSQAGLLLMCAVPATFILGLPSPAIFLALLISGFGNSLFSTSVTTVLFRDLPEVEARIVYSYYYSGVNAAAFLSPFIIYWLGYDYLRLVFIGALIVQLLVAVAYVLWFPRLEVEQSTRRATATHIGLPSAGTALLMLFCFGISYSLLYRQFTTNVSIVTSAVLLGSRELYPMLVSLNGALVVLIQPLYVRYASGLKSSHCMLMGAAAVLASFIIFAASSIDVAPLVMFAFLFTLGEVLIDPSVTALVYKLAPPNQKASWLTMYTSSRLAGGVGVMIGGYALSAYGVRGLDTFLLIASALMVSLAGVLISTQSRSERLVREGLSND